MSSACKYSDGSVGLTLTDKEAKAILTLTGSIAGSETKSGRKHTGAVYNALIRAGVKYLDSEEFDSLNHYHFAQEYPQPKPVEKFDNGEVYESSAGYKYLRTYGGWYDLEDRCNRRDGYPSRPLRKLN